jgi:hypothetical protein
LKRKSRLATHKKPIAGRRKLNINNYLPNSWGKGKKRKRKKALRR